MTTGRRPRVEWLPPPVELEDAVRVWRTHGGRREQWWLWAALVAFALEADLDPRRDEAIERLFEVARRLRPILGADDGTRGELVSNLLNATKSDAR